MAIGNSVRVMRRGIGRVAQQMDEDARERELARQLRDKRERERDALSQRCAELRVDLQAERERHAITRGDRDYWRARAGKLEGELRTMMDAVAAAAAEVAR